jgi:hypothetical protein
MHLDDPELAEAQDMVESGGSTVPARSWDLT